MGTTRIVKDFHKNTTMLDILLSALILLKATPPAAAFFGFMGCTSALVFACIGAAYGTAKSGVGVASMGVMKPQMVMRSIIPVVMAGVIGIYGLIIRSLSPQNCPTLDLMPSRDL